MACIKSAARSALVSFAPDAPYFAAGTMAGAVDLSFSATANLEIFTLDFQSDAHELPVVGVCPSDERFNRLSWGKPLPASEEYSLGLIAGGHTDGSIGVWNPRKLISPEDQNDAFVAKLEKHVGSVRGLEFSTLSPNLLASGADEGELCIWDLANPSEPNLFPSLKQSVGSGAQTEVSFVSWNPKFQQILSSTSYNGITVVWDLKQQKPVTSFADSSRTRCSVLQWNPDLSTQLIVASDDDSSPSLKVWDVRKTISPVREFVGHTKGIIAMSWCPYDSNFLLTCAKDNRTICWDTTSGEIVCELPASTNWNFDVHWYPKIPGVISASSFDVKVGIYNIQACSRYAAAGGEFGAPVRLRAPKWLKRPTGVSFAFGGKLVSFRPGQLAPGGAPHSVSEVYVHDLVTEHSLVSRSTGFEAAVQNGDKSSLRALCEQKSQDSLCEDDKETWNFLKIMFDEEGTARTKLLCHLGFTVPNESSDSTDNLGKQLENNLSLDSSPLFQGQASAFAIDNGEEFFNNPSICEDNLADQDSMVPIGEQVRSDPEGPIGTSDPSFDDSIQRALVVGNYKDAVSKCIAANRMADALVIAHAGGPSLWESTRDQYLKSSLTPYLKVVSAMVNNDLTALVNTRPLNLWKETLALLCTFAEKDQWTALCDTLAVRLLTVGNTLAATFCYICAGNVDKTVEIWSYNLKSDSDGRTYIDLLQDLMEKTIVLTLATGHKRFSASLSKLVENYAELLANQGLLTTALEYLKLLEPDEPSRELTILRDRISLSTEEKGAPASLSYESSIQQAEAVYGADHTGYVDHSQNYYQDKGLTQSLPQPHHNIASVQYAEGYHQSANTAYGGYQPVQPQFPAFSNPVTFQPPRPTQMFIPPQTNQVVQQTPPAAAPQSTIKPFVPAAPAALRNVEQYQQPSLGSQLYPSFANSVYQSGSSFNPSHGIGGPQPTAATGNRFTQPAAPATGQKGFMPVPNPNFTHTPGMSPAQPSSPTKLSQSQTSVVPSTPPPTVQTADTSNVPAELKPVVTTLTRLYNETSAALGGANASAPKKREIEDNSRKIGSLFLKLNSGDISPNAAAKLTQLCQALDSGDFAAALHIQVILTTSDWDECNFWLAALKRMIKTRQSVRI
ncbi:protein transport protein SEC31 homolog B-like isoform X1 [Zingiber officinale]|uniref:protein transport protein SEC31 homolog B-like isoform X1 n=1 Tax=Zingiber officinale TaxID=94328 RepID=UPI001C4D60CA|nr:protein transport protein SEC31 homolog B-like isoform X1 [Zingiber officinale]XP_042408153.1 protein transport protein SEC31 homolog B-like isoform X1 [Zingiber officinale]